MSAIPSGINAASQLAGSASGAQRRDAQSDRAAEAAANQRLSTDRQDLSARSLGDVGQTDGASDRDADGRRDDTDAPHHPSAEPQPIQDPSEPKIRAPDAFGERGGLLDCEA